MMRGGLAAAALLAVLASAALAGAIRFDDGWREQRFPLKRPNDWTLAPDRLSLASEGGVSLLYLPLAPAEAGARQASWEWSVGQSVPPTDLTRKGGDDRNLALYFLFLPEAAADRLRGAGLSRVLRDRDARALVYVHGGAHPLGAPLASPYLGPRGVTIPLQAARPGAAAQSVDLAGDFRRAFGGEPGVLFGLAVSADSDDTDASIRAELRRLILR
ncbi:DUF3047 domain-containing protein [Tropicimonas sediminicola]|uniref:DUF3047 domain-containing protein n=1 Tax=Tropicimonas sediminicola TaxID=1031541 RepID=A0A239K1R0_9RHOB|nr:DUF3047 domain-containing protein [Tropicimonas sediminicola]SNT12266.1 Protein of unknown function [Tropicimonas sediminicola]